MREKSPTVSPAVTTPLSTLPLPDSQPENALLTLRRRERRAWESSAGQGQMWRRQGERQETVPLRPGTCISIPAGTHFQFRSAHDSPLAAVGVTMPPWPGADEAYDVPGPWSANPGPGGPDGPSRGLT